MSMNRHFDTLPLLDARVTLIVEFTMDDRVNQKLIRNLKFSGTGLHFEFGSFIHGLCINSALLLLKTSMKTYSPLINPALSKADNTSVMKFTSPHSKMIDLKTSLK